MSAHVVRRPMLSLISLSLVFAGDFTAAASSPPSCAKSIINQCTVDASNSIVGTSTGMGLGGSGIAGSSGAVGTSTAAGSGAMSANAQTCLNRQAACLNKCQTKADQKSCIQSVAAKAQQIQADSTGLAKSATSALTTNKVSSTLLAGVAGAAVGAAAGLLIAKTLQQQSATSAPPIPTPTYGALQANGSLNCIMADSYNYADCDSYLTSACSTYGTPAAANTSAPVTGTVIANAGGIAASPDCASFNARYCSGTQAPPRPSGDLLANGTVTQVNLAGSGEGSTSPYCQKVAQMGFCYYSSGAAIGSRSQCPACLNLASTLSPNCATNPSACLGQNTTTNANSPLCAGDPSVAGSVVAANSTVVGSLPSTSLTTAKIARGPASDVLPSNGRNLFGTTSDVIQQRCASGKLLNCP